MMRPRRVMRRRAVARTAVVGGVAYAAAKHGARAGQPEQPQQEGVYEAAAAPAEADPVEQLKQLNELRQQGILTEEEFTAEKQKILGF